MKNITVMIVDDEKLVLEDLKSLVDWEALGFKIVATAFNGRQAIEKYKIYHPKVVFTDVKMPFMDGLELIRKLRELDNEACIFLLTAYEDFIYAKTAIQYGVKDYVIKSMLDETTFAGLLTGLWKSINQQNELQGMLKEKQILEFLEEPEGTGGRSLPFMYKKAYTYLFIEQDLPVLFADDAVPEDFVVSRKEITAAALPENFGDCEIAAVSYTPERRLLVMLDVPEVSQKRITEITCGYARRVKERLADTFRLSFTLYTVCHKRSLELLKHLYRCSGDTFQKKYLLGCGEIYSLEESGENMQTEMRSLDTEYIQEMVNRRESESLTKYLEEIYRSIESTVNYNGLRRVSRELYMLLKKNCEGFPGLDTQDLSIKSNAADWLDSLCIRKWFIGRFEALICEKEKMQSEAWSRPVTQAVEYIFRHYQEHTLTIGDIADRVHLSTGHLCGMFKKETGKTLNHYITEVRISEAKKLLQKDEMKIYEVSSAVGYQSSQYFSQIFYKMTGTYPTNWQKDKGRFK